MFQKEMANVSWELWWSQQLPKGNVGKGHGEKTLPGSQRVTGTSSDRRRDVVSRGNKHKSVKALGYVGRVLPGGKWSARAPGPGGGHRKGQGTAAECTSLYPMKGQQEQVHSSPHPRSGHFPSLRLFSDVRGS